MIDLWRLPGPGAWIAGLTTDRRSGNSGIVVCPSTGTPTQLVDALREAHEHPRDFFEVTSWPSDGGLTESTLTSRVAAALGVGSCAIDAATLAQLDAVGRVTVVVDARAARREQQDAWVSYTVRFAAGAKELPHTSRPTLWLFVSPTAGELPRITASDVGVVTRWWWGVMSSLDALTAALSLFPTHDRAASAAEIARWDLDLLEALIGWNGDLHTLEDVLDAHTAVPRMTETPTSVAKTKMPPAALVAPWSDRAVELWDDRPSLHVAVERRVRADAARMRVWMAQVRRVFPLIELERARLAEWLSAQLQPDGPQGAFVGADVPALEIGPLYACTAAHRSVRVPTGRIDTLRSLVDVRNALAHRTPLNDREIQALRRSVEADQLR